MGRCRASASRWSGVRVVTGPDSFPAYGVHRRYGVDASSLASDLREDGWRVLRLPPTTDNASFIAEAGRVLPLNPPVQSPNLDAFDDSLSSGLMELGGDPIAIIWERAEALRDGDPDAFSTAVDILAQAVFVMADPTMTGDGPVTRLLVFLLYPEFRPLRRG
jgi:hypothetical protein